MPLYHIFQQLNLLIQMRCHRVGLPFRQVVGLMLKNSVEKGGGSAQVLSANQCAERRSQLRLILQSIGLYWGYRKRREKTTTGKQFRLRLEVLDQNGPLARPVSRVGFELL